MSAKNFDHIINLSSNLILKEYVPKDLAKFLSFKEGLKVANKMLNDHRWEWQWHEYAVDLLNEIRKIFAKEWDSSWRYDAFLGLACDIALRYEERYEAYTRALGKVTPAPPELLVALAFCFSAPEAPISKDQAIILTQLAIKDTLYIEGVSLLIGLYKRKEDLQKINHWENVLESIKDTGIHLPRIEPRFLYSKDENDDML